MANSLQQNQIYTILNAINAQAKTGGALTAVDTSSFITVAQTALLSGYDNLTDIIGINIEGGAVTIPTLMC